MIPFNSLIFKLFFLTTISSKTYGQLPTVRVSFFTRIFQENLLDDDDPLRAIYKSRTRGYCAKLCAIEPLCMSYSYCEHVSCFLHSEDSFTAVNFTLNESSNCVYVEMERDEHPSCVSNGDIVKVTTDNGTEAQLCAINQKRVDGVWTEWNTTESNTSISFKIFSWRECLHRSHGGIDCSGESTWEQEIIFPVNQRVQTFDQGNNFCASKYPGCINVILNILGSIFAERV